MASLTLPDITVDITELESPWTIGGVIESHTTAIGLMQVWMWQ